MEQPTTSTTNNPHPHRFPIEQYAVLTQSAPALGRTLDEWYDFYHPASPGERTQMDMAVMASIQQQRVLACLIETVNQQVRTAIVQFDRDQEDEVQRFRDLLPTQPGVAVLGLERSALGVRFLIGRWERLLRLLHAEGTLYGKDVDEMINYQGARGTPFENLFESEGAYLTWIYCLMSQPAPKDADFVAIGNLRYMPMGLNDRKGQDWLGEVEVCRQTLKDLAQRELAQLRPREELLRTQFEIPARDGAEVRKQVLQGPIGLRLVRELETHERHFQRAYNAFLKGRAQSEKSGRLPGGPIPGLHGQSVIARAATVAPEPGMVTAEQAAAQRRQAADALAPGGANGIGRPILRGDPFQEAVKVSRQISPEEPEERGRAAAEGAGTAGV